MAGMIPPWFIQITDVNGIPYTVNVNHITRLQHHAVYTSDNGWILLDKDSFHKLQAFLNPQGYQFGEEIK
jgi:hypothetical protein